jgi:integrase
MRWEHIKNFDGPLPTISLIQKKTGSHVTIPIADSLREALRAVPEEHRTGYLLGEIAAHYLAGRRRRFIRAWRSLLEDVKLPTLLDTPVVTEIERAGPKGRKRYSFTYHSWRHTCATYLSGADSHYLLGHRNKQEKALGETANYRHEDLQRLKIQLDAIPIKQAENVIQLTATG